MQSLHLIFILDESGSMSRCYNSVINSVQKVVNNRRARAVVKDKISLIKFNDQAQIEILNKSVLDEFTVSAMRGGDTTFVKPLEKLKELLREIDFDVEIPIVMFLSDGQGESLETVLKYIDREIIKNADLELTTGDKNLLFFSIGYGDDADSRTLEEMAKAFNRG